jgi:hypothetical protein
MLQEQYVTRNALDRFVYMDAGLDRGLDPHPRSRHHAARAPDLYRPRVDPI